MNKKSFSNKFSPVRLEHKQRPKRKGMKAILYRIGRIWRNITDQLILTLSIISAVAVGVSIAIAIIAASNGIETKINVLLGTHTSAEFAAMGININAIHNLLIQSRDLLTKLAIGFTAALVALVTIVSARQRHREFSLKRQEGEHLRELILEQLGEAFLLCIIGGLIGIGLGLGLCSFIGHQLPLLPMSPNAGEVMAIFPSTTLLSFGVTCVIAIIFALFPKTEPTD